jgi:hypothetical protein
MMDGYTDKEWADKQWADLEGLEMSIMFRKAGIMLTRGQYLGIHPL